MTVTKKIENTGATIFVEGRVDTNTAPDFEKEIQSLFSLESLVIDFSKLDYISSAGLRVLLSAHKQFSQKKGLKLININDFVLEVFEVTGFKEILDIE